MKKLVLALVVFVGLIFVGCTDNSLEDLEKNNEIRKNAQLIDKDHTTNPGGSGQGQDDDNGEG